MGAMQARRTVKWMNATNVLTGLWLLIAPFILNYSGLEQATWNDMIIGVLVIILALVRTLAPLRYEGISWTTGVLGAWLVLAPFVLGYGNFGTAEAGVNTKGAVWNDIIAGVIVLSLSFSSAAISRNKAPMS